MRKTSQICENFVESVVVYAFFIGVGYLVKHLYDESQKSDKDQESIEFAYMETKEIIAYLIYSFYLVYFFGSMQK